MARQPSRKSTVAKKDNSFAATAKRLECDPSEEKFDRALRDIGKHGPGHKTPSKADRS